MNQEARNERPPESGAASLKWMALLHIICCGGALLVFALIAVGVSVPLAFLSRALPYLAIIGGLFAAGAFFWFFQTRCSACPWSPKNKADERT